MGYQAERITLEMLFVSRNCIFIPLIYVSFVFIVFCYFEEFIYFYAPAWT